MTGRDRRELVSLWVWVASWRRRHPRTGFSMTGPWRDSTPQKQKRPHSLRPAIATATTAAGAAAPRSPRLLPHIPSPHLPHLPPRHCLLPQPILSLATWLPRSPAQPSALRPTDGATARLRGRRRCRLCGGRGKERGRVARWMMWQLLSLLLGRGESDSRSW